MILANKEIFYEHNPTIGKISIEKCHLRLTSKIPITFRPYRCSVGDKVKIDQHVAKLLADGVIRPSTSPYSAPVLFVAKKDEGEKVRLCIDYTKLNDVTLSESYPMPILDQIKDLFLDAKWFSTVDVYSGFYHLEEEAFVSLSLFRLLVQRLCVKRTLLA